MVCLCGAPAPQNEERRRTGTQAAEKPGVGPALFPAADPFSCSCNKQSKQPTVSGLLHSRRAHHRLSPSAKTFRPRAAAGTTGPRDEKELSARVARGAWGGALRTLWAERYISEKLLGSSGSVPLIAKILRRPPLIPLPTRPRLRRALGCDRLFSLSPFSGSSFFVSGLLPSCLSLTLGPQLSA
uniref:Uncharacterized protein n=1 Tax=Rangifer tarandus platyrhynchus TaxID=3082113 RepID=A0ACB0FDF8_RANTA|nr:unnamed protein product [Rangifer tarandus platyrhynchus]